MHDAKQFNDDIVKPTLTEFDAEYSNLRRAFLAVAVVDALAAQIYAQAKEHNINPFELLDEQTQVKPEEKDDSYFREKITNKCSGFKIIRDVAKANKHAILTRGEPQVKKSSQIISKSIGYGEGSYGAGRYSSVVQIMAQLNDGKVVFLESELKAAHKTLVNLVELLEAKLQTLPL